MMSTVAEKLHKWSIQELNFASESGLGKIPDVESLRKVAKGKQQRIWTYVINHVRSRSTVDKIKRTLYLKKLMKEREENFVFNDYLSDASQLRTEISRQTERQAYLMRELSTVKDRILNIEQKVQDAKDDTFRVNQKTALLELVKQSYDEKNEKLKDLFSTILSYKNSLYAYQSVKVSNKAVIPSDFLYDMTLYDQINNCRIKDLINVVSNILKYSFDEQRENNAALNEKFRHKVSELERNNVLLTDFIVLFKEICESDLEQFAPAKSHGSSVNDFVLNKENKVASRALLTQLKCDSVYNSLTSIKNRKEIEKLTETKKKIFEDKMKGTDSEIKYTLIEKLAENDALMKSNHHLEDYLRQISDKTQLAMKKIRQQKLASEELGPVIQLFYNDVDLTFHLLYTFSDVAQKTMDKVNELKSFACTDLFESPFPQENWAEELKSTLIRDRKQTWEYCNKTNIFRSLFSETGMTSWSPEAQKTLKFKPFQNISAICENWVQFKQKLREEMLAQSETYLINSDLSVSELYAKILKLLEAMRFSIENGMLFVNDGRMCCHTNKSLIQEWWEQNAQYIPHIEYEGKTLKMWIDILSVLSDFQHSF